jgi:hypothetical protein
MATPFVKFGSIDLSAGQSTYLLTSARHSRAYRTITSERVGAASDEPTSNLGIHEETEQRWTLDIHCHGASAGMLAAITAYLALVAQADAAAAYWADGTGSPVHWDLAFGDENSASPRRWTVQRAEFPEEMHGVSEINSEIWLTMILYTWPGERTRP